MAYILDGDTKITGIKNIIMKIYEVALLKMHTEQQCDYCGRLLKEGYKAYKLYTNSEKPLLIVCPSCKKGLVTNKVTITKKRFMNILNRNFKEARINITIRSFNKILTDIGFTLDDGKQ